MNNEAQQPKGCRYIYGDVKADPTGWRYCQRETLDESAWCKHHYRVVYEEKERNDDP